MKKILKLSSLLILLSGCAEYSALVGPTYTMAKSGNVVETSSVLLRTLSINKTVSSSDEIISTLSGELKECKNIHSSNLHEVFFDTMDQSNCYKDPFSIYR